MSTPHMWFDSPTECVVDWDEKEWQAKLVDGELRLTMRRRNETGKDAKRN